MKPTGNLAVTNIGCIFTGDLQCPISEANTIIIKDRKIQGIGGSELLSDYHGVLVDACGMTVCPGLIDSHVHPYIGDYHPRQRVTGWIESYLHGGVTSMISAGESHIPGRPKDRQGIKAMTILAQRSYSNARPSGVKVYGGSLMLEKGLLEDDFQELADAGVWLAKAGLGGVPDAGEAAQMVAWAHKYGMRVCMHTGGPGIPSCNTITARDVVTVRPDVASHITGGQSASLSREEIDLIWQETTAALEILSTGNPVTTDYLLRKCLKEGGLERVIIGTDTPTGLGILPDGVLQMATRVAAVLQVAPGTALALATGNTARIFGLNSGIIAKDRAGDLVVMDAPQGSPATTTSDAMKCGDLPSIVMVIVDGEILVDPSRNTSPSQRTRQVLEI